MIKKNKKYIPNWWNKKVVFPIDIALMSIALNQSQVKQQASLSVMKKAMDQAKGNANFIQQMMNTADVQALQNKAQPHLGGNVDIKG